MRDTKAFKERFKLWKETGELPYEAGLPKYKPGKDGFISTLSAQQKKVMHSIIDYFRAAGLSDVDTAGIVANMFKESSFNVNAKDSAGYTGLVQMSPDMRTAVDKIYKGDDLGFIVDLISGKRKVKGYTNGYAYKRNAYKTGGDAAEAFRATFERNKAGYLQSRVDYGNELERYLQNEYIVSPQLRGENKLDYTVPLIETLMTVALQKPQFATNPLNIKPTNIQYPLNNDTPESISSWSSADSPSPKVIILDLLNQISQQQTLSQPQTWIAP